jgi:predicted ribosomally synthesized peptide with nif11-like leader
MSEEQINAFLEAIPADAGLEQKLRGVLDPDKRPAFEPDAVAAIAKEAGFSISAEEVEDIAFLLQVESTLQDCDKSMLPSSIEIKHPEHWVD